MYDEYYDNPLTNTNDLGSNYQSLLITDDDSPTYESIKIREKIIADNCGFKTSSMLLKKDADIIFAKINLNPVPEMHLINNIMIMNLFFMINHYNQLIQ